MRLLRTRTLRAECFFAALFSMLLSATPTSAQTVTAMWDPSPASQQVTGYQVCVGTSSLSCNVGLASVNGAYTSYAFAPSPGVRQYLAIRATNAAGVSPFSSEVSFSIPSFAQPANQTGAAGVAISPLALSIADPDGSPLTITHTGLPVGLSINSVTRQITGTPASGGTYNVTLFVNDGLVTVSRSFNWVISGRDLAPPSLNITSHAAGSTVYLANITLSGEASDLGRGGSGIVSVKVNGVAASGGSATGNNTASWSRMISLSVGANTISVEATDGAGNITMQQINLIRSAQVCTNRDDLNGGCNADLIWRNSVTGQNVAWFLSGSVVVGYASLPTVADPRWQLSTTADINRDGFVDLIWRHTLTGQNLVWYLNGTTVLGYANLQAVTDQSWQLVASGDFNRDGSSDLIWRNRVTGQNVVWFMNGTTALWSADLPRVADRNWQLVASGDVNQDGVPDVIWRNRVSGQNVVWYLNGATVLADGWLPTVADTAWRIVAAIDTDNDGSVELIWNNRRSGVNYVWYLSGTTVLRDGQLPTVADLNWAVFGQINTAEN